MVLTTYYLIL